MKFDEGKIYLKNIKTGEIHLYERYMAQNKNYAAIVPNPVKKAVVKQTETKQTETKQPETTQQTGSTQQPGSA